MKKLLLLLLIGLSSFTIVGCDDDDDNPSSQNNNSISKSMIMDATSSSKWAYFSFETGDSVTITNPSTSDAWDLAFTRHKIATNSGTSGNAMGGAYSAGNVDLSTVTQAPESGYVIDDSVNYCGHGGCSNYSVSPMISGGSGVVKDTVLGVKEMPDGFTGWMWFGDHGASGPSKNYTNNVYVVRTAKGNYAKIHVKDYYGGDGTKSGMIEFDYVYQPDGSRTFMESN